MELLVGVFLVFRCNVFGRRVSRPLERKERGMPKKFVFKICI